MRLCWLGLRARLPQCVLEPWHCCRELKCQGANRGEARHGSQVNNDFGLTRRCDSLGAKIKNKRETRSMRGGIVAKILRHSTSLKGGPPRLRFVGESSQQGVIAESSPNRTLRTVEELSARIS